MSLMLSSPSLPFMKHFWHRSEMKSTEGMRVRETTAAIMRLSKLFIVIGRVREMSVEVSLGKRQRSPMLKDLGGAWPSAMEQMAPWRMGAVISLSAL